MSARTIAANNGAGCSSATASYTAILDSTAPTGGALTVNGVAASAGGDDELEHDRQLRHRRAHRLERNARAPPLRASRRARSCATRRRSRTTSAAAYGSATTITGTPTQDAAAGIATGICYRYTLTGTDQVGNSATVSTIVKVDAAAPVTTDNTAAIGNGWKTTTQTVTLTPTDGNGSGIAATYYTTDGSTPTTSSTQGTSISLSATGQYTIQYFSVDNAGNVEPVETAAAVIRVDKVVPTNSLSLASASGAFLIGTRLYYKSNAAGSFTLTNTVTDADSGPGLGDLPGDRHDRLDAQRRDRLDPGRRAVHVEPLFVDREPERTAAAGQDVHQRRRRGQRERRHRPHVHHRHRPRRPAAPSP